VAALPESRWGKKVLRYAAIARNFSPDVARWKHRVDMRPVPRPYASRLGASRVARLDRKPDALLQIGAWYDVGGARGIRPSLRCSYHDANLAALINHHEVVFDSNARYVRRELKLERRVYDRMDLLMPMSEWLRRSFIEDFDQPESKVVAVGAGPNLSSLPDPVRRDFSSPRFLFVGREFERKGGRELLQAFERVRAERPDAELWLVGPSRLDLNQEGVRFMGRILRNTPEGDREMDRLYRAATAFVMPSRFEPFGIVFLEAMAYGLPCVGGDACAMPEIIADGVSGYVTPPANVDLISARLLALAGNPERSHQMGEAGRKNVLDSYNWDAVADRMVSEMSARLSHAVPAPR
jgi:glycosyltransferase involved in cell wall biosynthesis